MKLYFNKAERFLYNSNTTAGAMMRLDVAWIKLKRELYRTLVSMMPKKS